MMTDKVSPCSHRVTTSTCELIVAWTPLFLLGLAELCVWFITTFVVLVPLLSDGRVLGPTPSSTRPPTHLETAIGWLLIIVYQLLFVLLVISVTCTVVTSPGDIPSWLRSDGRSDLHSYSNLVQAVERKKKDGAPRFCRKTLAYKPDRAHYCHQTGRCVLQYQTFSGVLNTAVGFYNYKYYLLSLFYGMLTSFWVVAATAPEAINIIHRIATRGAVTNPGASFVRLLVEPYIHALKTLDANVELIEISVLTTLVIAILMCLPCLALFTYHTTLLAHGYTVYEWQQVHAGLRDRGESLFDYGMLNNFALTLGVYPLLWLVPTRVGVEGNGIFFPEKQHALHSWM